MDVLREGLRFNAWANERTWAALCGLTPAKLHEPLDGIYGSAWETARHLLSAEKRYVAWITGTAFTAVEAPDMGMLAEQVSETDRRLLGLADASATELERGVLFPRFAREATVSQMLMQVMLHSTEHRADLASAITRLGGAAPALDYIVFALDLERNNP